MADISQLSFLDGGPKQYADSIYSLLEPSFNKNKNRLAVIAAHQEPSHLEPLVGTPVGKLAEEDQLDCLAWTYEQFLRGSLRLAAGLQSHRINADSVFMTAVPNCADFWLCYLTTFLGKLNLAPIDFGTLLEPRKEQLQHFILLLKPKVFVISDAAGAEAVDAAERATGYHIDIKITLDWDEQGPLSDSWQTLESFAHYDDPINVKHILFEAKKDSLQRTAFTIFTSGTSAGRPKGCPRTVLSLIHSGDTIQRSWAEKPARRLVDTANFRVICLVTSVTTWVDGGAIVMSGPSSITEKVYAAMQKYDITDTVMITAQLRMIGSLPDFSPSNVTSLRTVPMGGDVVTKSAFELCEQMFPNCKTYSGHGMSECGNFLGWDFPEPQRFFGDIASVGTIRPGGRLKVVDQDNKIVARGTPGDLHFDSTTTIQHYLEDVQPETFYTDDQGRWMKTGDIAVVDKEGFVYILGRSKDIIKRAGIPITPAALESCLQPYAGAEVAVFGVPDPLLGAVPFAVLTTLGGKTVDDLKHRIFEVFGKDYALAGAVTIDQLGMKQMPLNLSGKIQKLDLQNALNARPELLPVPAK